LKKEDISFCSVDAPSLPNAIIALNNATYLRLHGTMVWYNYLYPEQKLREILSTMTSTQAQKKAIYLNNDPTMLHNGLFLMESFLNPKTMMDNADNKIHE
jgi:uncharacterized protein YecE (DUF72 family)